MHELDARLHFGVAAFHEFWGTHIAMLAIMLRFWS